MKIKMLVAITLALSLRPLAGAADTASPSYVGIAYTDVTGTNSVFGVERHWSTSGDKRVLSEAFNDARGNTAASLEATYVADRLISIQFEQKQTGEAATAEFKNGRIFYSASAGGKKKTSEENTSGEWVAFNAVPEYISKHWETLTQGGVVNFRIPIPIMRDSFGFSLSRSKTWVENGQRRSEFKLQSSSAIIRMLADPMYYVMSDSDRTLLEYRGRTIGKVSTNGKLKDLDATIKYRVQNP